MNGRGLKARAEARLGAVACFLHFDIDMDGQANSRMSTQMQHLIVGLLARALGIGAAIAAIIASAIALF